MRGYVCKTEKDIKSYASFYYGHESYSLDNEDIMELLKGNSLCFSINEEYSVSINMDKDAAPFSNPAIPDPDVFYDIKKVAEEYGMDYKHRPLNIRWFLELIDIIIAKNPSPKMKVVSVDEIPEERDPDTIYIVNGPVNDPVFQRRMKEWQESLNEK